MWTLVASLCLAWYAIIWSICLLGLSLAHAYFCPPVPRSPLSPHRTSGRSINTDSGSSISGISNDSSRRHQDDAASPSTAAPGVSILRPLSGLDCNLVSNLTSSFLQNYPLDSFEVILSIEDTQSSESQSVYSVAQKVVSKFPHVNARIIVGDEVAGVNPKINNLVRPYSQAKFDILWIVDSQVWSPPGALARAVDHLQRTHDQPRPVPSWLGRRPHGPRVGLVHHVPLAVLPGSSWGSQVERVFLSTTHAKMYLAINSLAIDSCVMGKSNMFRKSDLERVSDDFFKVGSSGNRGESGAIGSDAFAGGDGEGEDQANNGQMQNRPLLASSSTAQTPRPPSPPTATTTSTVRTSSRALARFGIYLAEDNMLALSLWRPPLVLSHTVARGDVAHTSVGDIRSLQDYAKRRMRWIRVRKHMVLGATLAEPLTESIVAGLLGLVSFRWFVQGGQGGWLSALTFLAGHFAAWGYVDWCVMVALQGGEPVKEGEAWTVVKAWCLREALALPIWAWAVSGSTVQWRDQKYQILSDGRAATISPSRYAIKRGNVSAASMARKRVVQD